MRKQICIKTVVWFLNVILLAGHFNACVYAAESAEGKNTVVEEAGFEEETVSGNNAVNPEEVISGNSAAKPERSVLGNSAAEPEETVSSNDGGSLPEAQYHFVEEDYKTVKRWLELYCPNGYEDLLLYDETWWGNLYDYERAYAEFLIGLIVHLSEDVYDGQELSECIRILEDGTDAYEFFKGTIFSGLTLEDLQALSETGFSLDDLEDFIAGAMGERESDLFREYMTASEEDAVSEELKITAALAEKLLSAFSGTYALKEGDLVAKTSVSVTGYSGTDHGIIYKIVLGGQPALCFNYGKRCRNGYLYKADPGTYDKMHGPMGYFTSRADRSGAEYAACQFAAWLYLESPSYTSAQVKSRAAAMLNIGSEEALNVMISKIWMIYANAKLNASDYYIFYSDQPNSQRLGVSRLPDSFSYTAPTQPVDPGPSGGKTISETVTLEYNLEIHKRDWQTGVGLPGCEVEVYGEGEYLTTLTTDDEGRAACKTEKTETFSASYDDVTVTKAQAEAQLATQVKAFREREFTFNVSEIKAPRGYVWEANDKSKSIIGGETAVLDLTNERTLGAVELVKYDTESESGTAQGDAFLDGAVYGIYAAENIVHQDGKTGILFRKGELVKTAETGKTSKRNGDGYILNTDGSRHIANPNGEIAYEDTPGKTLFGDLELGSYYIKEIKPPEGYLFDEAVYPASFTYKWQTVKIESRNEKAESADNELTADDNDTSKTVFSGDHVMKQGVQFVKTSDNTWQTELQPIEGAGFCIYLINDLSGVKDGSIRPLGESWTADDIMTFYEYDFTGEPTAKVYKRTGHEEWTYGDKLWLAAGTAQNEYYVKEMFTDKDGRIVTPELPYGTYVAVETTTPEHHVCAKPFIISVTKDGGVLYTDETKQTVEKTFTPEERIRYGDHKSTKRREGRILQKQRIINNTVTKTFLRVLKADKEFTVFPGTYIEAGEFVRGTVLKEGAEYRIRCLTTDLSRESLAALNWKTDQEGYLSYYDANAKMLTGTGENPFRTSFLRKDGKISDCYITLPQEIPVGTYELTELTAPEGFVLNGCEQTIEDVSKEGINGYQVVDTPFPKVVFTINNGSVYPDGQMGTNKFALSDEYGNLTVTVLQENQEQKGVIEIYKHGEQLSGTHEDTKTLTDKLKGSSFRAVMKTAEAAHKDLIFEYEDAPVEGAVFDIIAAEDIYTGELQKDLSEEYKAVKEAYLIHKKGDVVATVTTDRNGWGYAAGLYIGKYKIAETKAGNGFVLNTAETEFEITPQDQKINFDFHSADYKNERQKVEIEAEKKDADSGEALSEAVYGLYAGEDIYTNIISDSDTGKWIVRDTPVLLHPADTLIATCITDGAGKGIFHTDLPHGNYYVRELEGPAGYLTTGKELSVNGRYDSPEGGQNVEKQEHRLLFQNRKTQAVITKLDIADSREIAGAVLQIKKVETDSDGNPKRDAAGEYITETVSSWISKGPSEEVHYFYENEDGSLTEIEKKSELPTGKELIEKNGHLIRGLQVEQIYMLTEKTAPDGYGYAEDILFKLIQEKENDRLTDAAVLYFADGENWSRAEDGILAMFDEKQALEVEKSTIGMTQPGDNYKYTVDELRNLTEETLDCFTLTDRLPKELYLTELWTGTYNENLLYDVEYKINRSGEWIKWGEKLTTGENHHFVVPEELRSEGNHVSQFRMVFGTVGAGFGKVEPAVYFTTVLPGASETILNEIELTAEQNGRPLCDRDETETILYFKRIAGYGARGGGFPLYEIVETENEMTEERASLIRQIILGKDAEEESGEETPSGYFKEEIVRTGDDSPIGVLIIVFVFSCLGLIVMFGLSKSKK